MENAKQSLESLFRPQSIAIIGASGDPRKIGGRPISHLKRSGYPGRIYPINASHSEVQGMKAFPSIDTISERIDLAVIAVPADTVPAAIDAAIIRGVRAVVVFSAGFGEVDAAGKAAQEKLAATCRAADVRMLGPNTVGLFNANANAYATFMTSLDATVPGPGNIGVVSQSGAFGAYLHSLAIDRGLRFSQFIATGNEADVDVADCIGWMAGEPSTTVILAYMEGCRNGRRLREALSLARDNRKPVVIMKVGRSQVGAAAAASHTGALAGSDAVFNAIFEEYAVHRAHSVDEMLDIAYACTHSVLPEGNRLGVLTVSGGVGVMSADLAAELGLELPSLPPSAQAEIKRIVPFASGANPVDTTAQTLGDRTLFVNIFRIMLESAQFDAVFAFLSNQGRNAADMAVVKPALLQIRHRHPARMFVLCTRASADVRDEFERNGLLVFEEPTRAVATIAALAGIVRRWDRKRQPSSAGQLPRIDLPEQPNEAQSKAILARAGIPFAPDRVVKSPDELATASAEIGFPLAMKVLSPDIAHKSEVGGVSLNISGTDEARTAWHAMMASVKRSAPAARIEGVLLTPMITGGIETVLGVSRDPVFGPMVMFGLGGIFIEVLQDIAFRAAPIDQETAREMIRSVRGFKLLQGARGQPAADIDRIAKALVALSNFAVAHVDEVASVEVNPFMAMPTERGGGCGIDALIVRG